MIWHQSYRADPKAREVADRHYNRQKPGTPNFVPPGRCCVFYTENQGGKALWVTSFPFAQYVRHQWAGAWVCSAFRNEGGRNRLRHDPGGGSSYTGIFWRAAAPRNDNIY